MLATPLFKVLMAMGTVVPVGQGDVLRPVLKGTCESGSADEEAEHIVVVRAHELRVPSLANTNRSSPNPRRHEVELQHGIASLVSPAPNDLFQVRVGERTGVPTGSDQESELFDPGPPGPADEHTLSKPGMLDAVPSKSPTDRSARCLERH